MLLGSYFYGYIATQMIGGWLSKQYGGKYPFGIGILLCTILTLVTPVAATEQYGYLMAIRIVEGLSTVNQSNHFYENIVEGPRKCPTRLST